MVLEPAPGSEVPSSGLGRVRPPGRVPSVLSVALIGALAGLLIGVGVGYRLGAAPVPATATTSPTQTPDIEADQVSPRLELAVDRAGGSGGWAVCALAQAVACTPVAAEESDPRVTPSEYGLGWYGRLSLTRVTVSPAHLVLAGSIGDGSIAVYLNEMGPGDNFLEVRELTPVSPGRRGTFYFDLGALPPGHYVAQIDFIPSPPAQLAGDVAFSIVGFIVG